MTERTLTVHANPGVAAGDSNGRTHTHSQRYTKEGGARVATQGGRLAQRWCSICWAVKVATAVLLLGSCQATYVPAECFIRTTLGEQLPEPPCSSVTT